MAKRALIPGDLVCIRPGCMAEVSRSEGSKAQSHVPCRLIDRIDNGRRVVLTIGVPWEPGAGHHDNVILAWPSQVRLARGAEERLWKREQKAIAEIEAMKAERRKGGKRRSPVPSFRAPSLRARGERRA